MKILTFHERDHAAQTHLAICLGFFDGIHTAHQTLMSKTIEEGKKRGLETAMMTFSTHILSFLKQQPFQYVSSMDDKISAAVRLGFDYFYILDVSFEVVKMEPDTFIQHFLQKQDLVVIGFDFTFGYRGLGNADLLKRQTAFDTIVIDELDFENEKIGSSRIRQCILNGKMEEVAALIGKPYAIKGEVIKGKNRGKSLGFPTANIHNLGYLIPKRGVYIAQVKIQSVEYKGLANVGINPTFEETSESIEVHILDFDSKLYGETVEVMFLHYIREEIKFDHIDDLKSRMTEDELYARNYFHERIK